MSLCFGFYSVLIWFFPVVKNWLNGCISFTCVIFGICSPFYYVSCVMLQLNWTIFTYIRFFWVCMFCAHDLSPDSSIPFHFMPSIYNCHFKWIVYSWSSLRAFKPPSPIRALHPLFYPIYCHPLYRSQTPTKKCAWNRDVNINFTFIPISVVELWHRPHVYRVTRTVISPSPWPLQTAIVVPTDSNILGMSDGGTVWVGGTRNNNIIKLPVFLIKNIFADSIHNAHTWNR